MSNSAGKRVLQIGLIGFGRTGREVAKHLLCASDVELRWVVRESTSFQHRPAAEVLGLDQPCDAPIISAAHEPAMDLLNRLPVDAIIDFSAASGVDYYYAAASRHRVAVVSAVSHYDAGHEQRLRWLSRHIPVLWSPNITLGVNVMMLAAQTLQRIAPAADIQIVEEHFRDKLQVSGTALRIAAALDVPQDAIHMVRAGGIVGTHEVVFGLPTQTLRFRHEAISRQAFGDGARFAALHIAHRAPGLYSMEELLRPYFVASGTLSAPDETSVAAASERIPA
jgi:4-hydroxy-tetrahydrodipicolinate reductase